MLAQQISFEMDSWQYDTEINYIEKELRKDLMKGILKYRCNKQDLKNWFCNKFFTVEFLENITNEDLYYVAEELVNLKLI